MELILIWLVLGIITGYIAGRKGYSTLVCIVLALCGLIGVLVALVLPKQHKEITTNASDPRNRH